MSSYSIQAVTALLQKIEQLKGIFKNPKNRLFIDETLIINILEFNKYLKEYGFENIEEK